MPITPKQEKIVRLAEAGGTDKELMILDEIDALETKLDEKTAELEKKVADAVAEVKAIPSPLPVEIKGAELLTIKGEKGESGDKGEAGTNGQDGTDGKDGLNGINGTNGEDGENGIDGQQGKAGKDGSPDTPEQIRGKLETLQGDDRIDVSAIKGLEERIKAIPERRVGAIFGPGKTRVILLDLSNSLDGVTKTFFIGTHYGITGVWGSSTPFPFRPIVDYNEVGKNIVFAAGVNASISLAAGQTLIVQYLR